MSLSMLNSVHFNIKKKNKIVSSVPLKQTLSSQAQTAFVGAYNIYLVSSTYTGPILNIRRSSDNTTSDFYGNINGTLGQSSGGNGTSLSTWLNGSTAYVTIWYDQSGMGNNATQNTNTLQPTYNLTKNYIDFASPANSYFAIPNGTIPTGNSPYTISLKHNSTMSSNGGFIGGGSWGTGNSCLGFRFSGGVYKDYWWGNDFHAGTMAANNTVTTMYIQNVSKGMYVNGTLAASQAASNHNQTSGGNYIGVTNNITEFLNAQLYFIHIFNISLTDEDRVKSESGH